MSSIYFKILAVLLIFLGEALAIYAEIFAARTNSVIQNQFLQIFFKMFLIIMIAGALLIVGYMLGFNAFKNIWIVAVISITSILIIEPILAYFIFKQLPTKGAFLGFLFGILGFLLSILLK